MYENVCHKKRADRRNECSIDRSIDEEVSNKT
jgi:hypothetical protein